ncbi:MAG: hypothetical protein ACRD3E_12860 [Terriglobales bacterium]
MKAKTERGIWRWVGAVAFAAGVAVMIWALIGVAGAFEFDRTWPRREAGGAAVALAGVACLVIARVIGLMVASEEGRRGVLWTVFSYGAVVVGGIGGFVQAILWRMSVSQVSQAEWMTAAQKCNFVVLGFLFLAGLIALIGQRAAARLAERATPTAVRERVAHR